MQQHVRLAAHEMNSVARKGDDANSRAERGNNDRSIASRRLGRADEAAVVARKLNLLCSHSQDRQIKGQKGATDPDQGNVLSRSRLSPLLTPFHAQTSLLLPLLSPASAFAPDSWSQGAIDMRTGCRAAAASTALPTQEAEIVCREMHAGMQASALLCSVFAMNKSERSAIPAAALLT